MGVRILTPDSVARSADYSAIVIAPVMTSTAAMDPLPLSLSRSENCEDADETDQRNAVASRDSSITLRPTPDQDSQGEEEEGDDDDDDDDGEANANRALRYHFEGSIFGEEYKTIYKEAVCASNALREDIRETNTRRDAEIRRVNEVANSEIHFKELLHLPIKKRKMDELVAIVNKMARYEARKEMDAERAEALTSMDGQGDSTRQDYEERLKQQSKEHEGKLTDLQATFDLIIKTQEEEHEMALVAAQQQQEVEYESKVKAMLEDFEKREAEHKAVLKKSGRMLVDGHVQTIAQPFLQAEIATLTIELKKVVEQREEIKRELEDLKKEFEASILAERQERDKMLQMAVQEIQSYQMKLSKMKIEYDYALKEQRRELEAKMEDAIIKEKRMQMKAMASEMEAIRVAKEEGESQQIASLDYVEVAPLEEQTTVFDYAAFFKTKREG